MKLPKAKVSRFDDEGMTEIIRSELSIGLIDLKVNAAIQHLSNFVRATQKGERQIHLQKQMFINRYSKQSNTNTKVEYHLYLKAVEHAILEMHRMVEVYHHEFVSQVDSNYQIDLAKSPKFDECKRLFKNNGIYISRIAGYECIVELKNVSNDLKHAYIQEFSLSRTFNLRSFREFDRKMLVDKVNRYFEQIPIYIISLAQEINEKYPKIERKTCANKV
jgi:hypothetical protein